MDPSIHLVERQDRRGRRLSSLALLAVVTTLGASLFGLFAFLEANTAFGTVEDVADTMLCDPDEFDLSLPVVGSLSEVYTADGVLLGQLTLRNSQPVPMDEIPELVQGAVISAEKMLYYYNQRGELKLISARDGKMKEISSFKITKGSGHHFSHPVIHRGVLYQRRGDALMAFDIRRPNP